MQMIALATVENEETDQDLAAARTGRERLCLATREVKPVEEMIRYVVAPDGRIAPDLERKLPGRGAWVSATRSALVAAMRENAFGRAFRGRGRAEPELPEMVERLLERSALDALSLANKAGLVLLGFAKTEHALGEGKVAILVHAREAAPEGVRKLQSAAARAGGGERPASASISIFTGAQLDLALGRSNVVHAALLAHPASQAFLARSQRLERWRNGGPAGWAEASADGSGRRANLGKE
jgi:predicted RNA-binding protein YlxR (DUF448 family)